MRACCTAELSGSFLRLFPYSAICIKSIFFFGFLFAVLSLSAQVPQGIPYQAVARNNAGQLISASSIRVRFTVHDSMANGNTLYRESFNPSTNTLGLFNVTIGEGTVSLGNFATINWGRNAKFLQVEMDPSGGTTYVDMGTTQLMSVPYALYSQNGLPNGANNGDMLYWHGSAWVKIPAGINGLTLNLCGGVPTWGNCAVPTLTTDTASNVLSTTAYCGGNIVSNGGYAVTRRRALFALQVVAGLSMLMRHY